MGNLIVIHPLGKKYGNAYFKVPKKDVKHVMKAYKHGTKYIYKK